MACGARGSGRIIGAVTDDAALLDPETWRAIDEAIRWRQYFRFTVDGANALLTFGQSTYGAPPTCWTIVHVALKPTALCFELRPRARFTGLASRVGLAIDVRTGDPSFDADYEVEAAPEDVARALLDAPLRARLCATRDISATLTPGALEVRRIEPAGDEATRDVVALAVLLARRVREAEGGGGGDALHYRDDPARIAQRHAARAVNLAQLEAVRKRRQVAKAVAAVAVMVVGTAVRTM